MPIQPHHTLQNQIRHIQPSKPQHMRPARKLRPHPLRKIQRSDQSAHRREQKPLRHGVLEEHQARELATVVREIRDEEADQQARVLRDEVEA
jgi:hypothetical protein